MSTPCLNYSFINSFKGSCSATFRPKLNVSRTYPCARGSSQDLNGCQGSFDNGVILVTLITIYVNMKISKYILKLATCRRTMWNAAFYITASLQLYMWILQQVKYIYLYNRTLSVAQLLDLLCNRGLIVHCVPQLLDLQCNR